MGQGQEVIARRYMAAATVEGQWVLLQNTHLGLGYLTEVEQFLTKAEDLHEDFRLWITAEPHPQFPIGLLQVRRVGVVCLVVGLVVVEGLGELLVRGNAWAAGDAGCGGAGSGWCWMGLAAAGVRRLMRPAFVPPADGHQGHQRGAGGHEGGAAGLLPVGLPGEPGAAGAGSV
jgi:hypothetical protein